MKIPMRMLLLLFCVVLIMPLAACAPSKTSPAATPSMATGTQPGDETPTATPAIDISKEVTLQTFWIGDKPQDTDLVMEQVNKLLKEKVNATINLQFLSWSDFQTQYSLVLSGGEDVDLMYTSDWCFFSQEAAKGAFMELTPDFLKTYMPKTMSTEKQAAWNEATIKGKIYCVPENALDFANEYLVAIRDDLRKKYNLPEPKSLEDLQNYYYTIAENEKGIYPFNASVDNNYLKYVVYINNQSIVSPAPGYDSFVYKYEAGKVPTADDIYFCAELPGYSDFCHLMRQWEQKGVWSKDAISNTVSVQDSFENGKSASLAWNTSVFDSGDRMTKNNSSWEVGYYDINVDKPKFPSPFTNDAIAIAASSKNPERAAMVLDLMKNDDGINMLMLGGISGKHYVDMGNKTFKAGPDALNYPWLGFAWALKRGEEGSWTNVGTSQARLDVDKVRLSKVVYPPTDGFRFDETPVKAELAAVNEIIKEYQPLLELGLADDVDGTLAKFISESKKAGLDKVEKEFKAQYTKYMESKNK